MYTQKLLKRIARHWQLYVFLLIPVAFLLIFRYYPMLGVQIAFRKFRARDGIWGSEWVGLKNFLKFMSSYQFSRLITNTVMLSLYSIIASFPIPIIFALMLNVLPNGKLKKVSQTITYMPHFISTIVLIGIMQQIFNPLSGLFSSIYRTFFPQSTVPMLLGEAGAFRHLYVWSGIWQQFGWSSIIYVAALSGVSPELHEAAQIDGATRFQRVLHVELPAILPTITIMLILRAGNVMSVGFEKVFLMQNDLNISVSEVISTYVYKVSLKSSTPDYSYSTAINLFNSLVNMLLIYLVNWFSAKVSETSLW